MAPPSLFFISLSMIVFLVPNFASGDPCVLYKSINDHRRSTAYQYKVSSGESPLCDRSLTTGWYRFINNAGGEMPTTKVQSKQCGTLFPIWMNGIHPDVSEGEVTRTACINQYDMNNGCARQVIIKVKNCYNQYYVYWLQRLRSCSMAYCAGDKVGCPAGRDLPDCTAKVNCKVEWLGCYKDDVPPSLSEFILTGRNKKSSKFYKIINWKKYGDWLPQFACACAEKAKALGYNVFGIQYFGECMAGSGDYSKYGASGNGCRNSKYKPCTNESNWCTGIDKVNSVYKIIN